MSKFKKKKGGGSPGINTSALPDIIFMLLFFFMVATVMRDADLKVNVSIPQATQLTKLKDKTAVGQIYVGRPSVPFQAIYGKSPVIQMGDKVFRKNDIPTAIPTYITAKKDPLMPKQQGIFTMSLRVDKTATMGLVQDVKQQLRKSEQLLINYASNQRSRDLKDK